MILTPFEWTIAKRYMLSGRGTAVDEAMPPRRCDLCRSLIDYAITPK